METNNPIRFAAPAPWLIKAAMVPVSLLMLLMLTACAQQPWLHEQAAEPEPVPAPEPVVAEERNPTPEQENPTSEKEKPTPKKEKTSLWEWNGNDRQISHIEVDLKRVQEAWKLWAQDPGRKIPTIWRAGEAVPAGADRKA